jgi:hypothetical protein
VATAGEEPGRLQPVRRRAAVAKAVLAIGAAVGFGGAVALSRAHNAGHAKQPLRPLGALPGYAAAVHRQVGFPGMIDPPLASPSAATHVS